MSILDGKVYLNGETPRNDNQSRGNSRSNGKGNNKHKQKKNSMKGKYRVLNGFTNNYRSFNSREEIEDKFSKTSYLTDEKPPKNVIDIDTSEDERANEILRFCEEFTDNVDNYRELQEIMLIDFPSVVRYIKYYYGKNSNKFQDALNKLIYLACTIPFSKILSKCLTSKDWEDDNTYNEIWDSIGVLLCLALELEHPRMHTDVIKSYALNIIPRLYGPEIDELCADTGITKTLANDLIIAIPVKLADCNVATLDASYIRFLDKILIHAEDNSDVLNAEVQGRLYDKIFGTDKIALKAIGKFLISEPFKSKNPVQNEVYDEFKHMLYSRLDSYDIEDIIYVLNFVIKKASNITRPIMFEAADIEGYDNIRKALDNVTID